MSLLLKKWPGRLCRDPIYSKNKILIPIPLVPGIQFYRQVLLKKKKGKKV
jgi:hypothetical protein